MKILFISLGCDKNLCDSEVMLRLLSDSGHEITDDENEAEAVVINTCGFIQSAKEESIDTILRMDGLRENGRLKYIIAAGCMSERYRDEMLSEMTEVDAIVGTTSYDRIVDALNDCVKGERKGYFRSIDDDPEPRERLLSAGSHRAYIKIAEGCDKHCTYCAIPLMRGHYRSRPEEDVLKEAEELAKAGVRELILVAQETTLYGKDLYGRKTLPALLRKLCRIDGIEWIRLLYCYPEEITKELINTMASERKIVHYIDMPIQSGSDTVLKRMGRRITGEKIREIVSRIREGIPDIALRTTIISGFPGETEEEHEETLELVRELRFERLGVFEYSKEEGTPAAKLKPQIRADVKRKRRNSIMALQQKIAFEKAGSMTGKTVSAIVEGKLTDEKDIYLGRTYMDAPDVDGFIFIRSEEELLSGDILDVKVTMAREYDLIGEADYEHS
ncbi:MAG: 30S ribosomal protein S12 methylthiotransferase RimO [Lachnospiraceae bacterium]|nr:30S ribosomal protein S12 methylthiotransferase RimO [Lachnospiraceae bacterium]